MQKLVGRINLKIARKILIRSSVLVACSSMSFYVWKSQIVKDVYVRKFSLQHLVTIESTEFRDTLTRMKNIVNYIQDVDGDLNPQLQHFLELMSGDRLGAKNSTVKSYRALKQAAELEANNLAQDMVRDYNVELYHLLYIHEFALLDKFLNMMTRTNGEQFVQFMCEKQYLANPETVKQWKTIWENQRTRWEIDHSPALLN